MFFFPHRHNAAVHRGIVGLKGKADLPLQKSMRINTSHTSPPPTAVMLESRNPTMFLWPLRSLWNTIHREQKVN